MTRQTRNPRRGILIGVQNAMAAAGGRAAGGTSMGDVRAAPVGALLEVVPVSRGGRRGGVVDGGHD
jgi:hypothetical protein